MTIADTLRKKADGLQKKIDHCFHERLTNTRKRADEDAHQRREGNTLKATQDVMRKLADLHEAGACPAAVKDWRHTTEVETAVRVVRSAERQKEEYGDRDGKCLERLTEEQKIVRGMMHPVDAKVERLHQLMRDSVRWNIPGYHPTGREAVEEMIELADIKPGMSILEPSAGRGDILDVVRMRFGDDVSLTVVEYNHSLKEILGLKGYEVQTENDFLQWEPCEGVLFDRILLNPPFEKFQDIDHVRRAYTFLKPGGRLVAIMSPGTFFRKDKKAQAFQDDYGDCKIVTLESGCFESTNITAKMIVIDKPGIHVVAAKDKVLYGDESLAYQGYPEVASPPVDAETAEQTRFFRAADRLEVERDKMSPAAAAREEERIHQLARVAFPETAAAYEAPPIAGAADPEYETRLDAQRVTAEFETKSQRPLDSGREPITDAPIFGGPAQYSLF